MKLKKYIILCLITSLTGGLSAQKTMTGIEVLKKDNFKKAGRIPLCLLQNIYNLYLNCSKIEVPMVPSGIFTSKLSATVAPITPKVSVSGNFPPSFKDGE